MSSVEAIKTLGVDYPVTPYDYTVGVDQLDLAIGLKRAENL